jgi:hypothetical protein
MRAITVLAEWLAKPAVAALESQSKLRMRLTTRFRLNYGHGPNPIVGARCHPLEICLSLFEIKNQAFLELILLKTPASRSSPYGLVIRANRNSSP